MLFLTFRRIMHLFFTAPIVKWISQLTSDQLFWVRVLVGAQCYRAQNTAYLSSVLGSTSGILYIYMFGKIKNLIISLASLIVIVVGVLSVLMVLGMVTVDQLISNMTTMIQVSVIVLVAATTLMLLLSINKK